MLQNLPTMYGENTNIFLNKKTSQGRYIRDLAKIYSYKFKICILQQITAEIILAIFRLILEYRLSCQ